MSVFGVILVRIFPHLDWIRENTDQNTSECGHFSRSVFQYFYLWVWKNITQCPSAFTVKLELVLIIWKMCTLVRILLVLYIAESQLEHCQISIIEIFAKIVKVCIGYIFSTLFLSLKESTYEIRKNVFYFILKALFSFSRKLKFRILDIQIS